MEGLDREFFEYLEKFKDHDPHQLALQASKYKDYPIPEIVKQLQSRNKAKQKLPEWFSTPNIYFPSSLAMEQCSSEVAARYKAKLMGGNVLMDMTGGAGVDTYYLSQNFSHCLYFERNQELAEITRYNFEKLQVKNVEFFTEDSESWLQSMDQYPSHVYVDPARRDQHNRKMTAFENCEPNVIDIVPSVVKAGVVVMVKASPMIDLKKGLQQLPETSEVHVVSVNNECKEVLFVMDALKRSSEVLIKTVNINSKKKEDFTFTFEWENDLEVPYGEPLQFLYEPNASILKAGGFKTVAQEYAVQKLAPNSHLYSSKELVSDFPGRKFEITHVLAPAKKELKQIVPTGKVSITTRNYPLDVKGIQKKYGFKDGADAYLFFTKLASGKPVVLVCQRINQSDEN